MYPDISMSERLRKAILYITAAGLFLGLPVVCGILQFEWPLLIDQLFCLWCFFMFISLEEKYLKALPGDKYRVPDANAESV